MLMYEYMPQGLLSMHLFEWAAAGLRPLEWKQRVSIALDVARGVEYLHSLAQTSFIHRDLKPSNILLGDDMRAKVSDFELVKLAPDGKFSVDHAATLIQHFSCVTAPQETVNKWGFSLADLQVRKKLMKGFTLLFHSLFNEVHEEWEGFLGPIHIWQTSFIHRDLKPSNILLGDDTRAKVSDFELVKLARNGKFSVETRLAGTFGYLAPEYAVKVWAPMLALLLWSIIHL